MPFWKKSEDPWDMESGRPVSTVETPEQGETVPDKGLADQLQDWNDARKAEKARKQAEKTPAPIPCPWCGKPMTTGYLMGSRGTWWAPGVPDFVSKWISVGMAEGAFRVDTEGVLSTWQTAWYCEDCRKLAVDVPETPEFGCAGESAPETQPDSREETPDDL